MSEILMQHTLVFTLLAFSVQIALRSGVFSLAGIGCWAVGAYASALLAQGDVPVLVGVAAAVAMAVVIGVVLALVLGRLRALYMAMATLAFVLLVQTLAQTLDLTGGALGLYGVPVEMTTGGLVAVVVVSAALLVLLERGRPGRALEVLRLDELLASAVGLNVVRWRVAVFVLSCALGGLSGALYPLLFTAVSPEQVGFGLVVDVLTMIVIGGTAAWWGAPVGAFVVIWLLPEMLSFSGSLQDVVQGLIVVIMAVYVPEGVVGLVHQMRRALAVRWGSPQPTAFAGGDAPTMSKILHTGDRDERDTAHTGGEGLVRRGPGG